MHVGAVASEARRGQWIPRAGVTGGCEPLSVGAGNQTGPLQEQLMLVATEPGLQASLWLSQCDFLFLLG